MKDGFYTIEKHHFLRAMASQLQVNAVEGSGTRMKGGDSYD